MKVTQSGTHVVVILQNSSSIDFDARNDSMKHLIPNLAASKLILASDMINIRSK